MNLKQLIANIAEKTDLPLAKVDAVLKTQQKIITQALIDGEQVSIPGFVTYKPVTRKARSGVNPKTGEAIQVDAKETVKLTPGKTLKDAIAKGSIEAPAAE